MEMVRCKVSKNGMPWVNWEIQSELYDKYPARHFEFFMKICRKLQHQDRVDWSHAMIFRGDVCFAAITVYDETIIIKRFTRDERGYSISRVVSYLRKGAFVA